MLAQNFKTATDLGISEIEHGALCKVLGMLERGELRHTPIDQPILNGFNMQQRWGYSDCGSACCLMGWADLIAGEKLDFNYGNANQRELFTPDIGARHWGSIQPAQAAIALRNYLTHGEPRWSEALAAVE